jgi:hypothetical protein
MSAWLRRNWLRGVLMLCAGLLVSVAIVASGGPPDIPAGSVLAFRILAWVALLAALINLFSDRFAPLVARKSARNDRGALRSPLAPQFPVRVLFREDDDEWVLDSEHELAVSLEYFDSDDPAENADVRDALGRAVRVKVDALRVRTCELLHEQVMGRRESLLALSNVLIQLDPHASSSENTERLKQLPPNLHQDAVDVLPNVMHFVADADIRARDAEYDGMQRAAMSTLIDDLRREAPRDELLSVNFLE